MRKKRASVNPFFPERVREGAEEGLDEPAALPYAVLPKMADRASASLARHIPLILQEGP
jgi:hypothetical protein